MFAAKSRLLMGFAWIGVGLLLLLRQTTTIQAVWLRNWAVIELQGPWLARQTDVLDPQCYADANMPQAMDGPLLALNNQRTVVYWGRVLWLAGQCHEAVIAWQQASIEGNDIADFELFRLGRYETLTSNERFMLANIAFKKASLYLKTSDTEAAYQWFSRAFELAPQRRSAAMLAQLNSKAGNMIASIRWWQRLAEILPLTDPDHWWALAELDAIHGEWESAAIAYTHGAGLTSESFDFWMRAGDAWEKSLDIGQALAAYEYARQARPDGIQPYLSLGHVNRRLGQYPEALHWYLEAARIQPQNFTPHFFLGETYYLMGEYTQARQNLETALMINPDHNMSMYYLAQAEYGEGNLDLAEAGLVDAINHTPKSPMGWWMQLGDWRLERRDCVGAREAYTRAQEAGTSAPLSQQKQEKLAEVCNPSHMPTNDAIWWTKGKS